MQVRKTSIFVLSLLLSYEAFGANASIRAGALRLNQPQNSVSNTANKTTSEKLSINDTLSGYNRASSLRPNRVQVSGGGNKNPAVNEEVLNKVYEEMERVTSAVEQELYLTSREIKTLKDEIAEKDEKIKDLELALEDYEEMKETVKNIPNIYYSKREVDSKGYVMPSTLSSAIETAKSTVKKEALAEVNSKGFITSSAVADEIAQAKNAAVSAAVAQVENMNFATANSVAAAETRLANAIDSAKATITNERNAALQLYAKTSDVASEITLAKNTAIADAKTQTIAAIEDKNYATQQFVNTELSNLDLGIDEAAVGTIIENKLLAKDYATKSFAENKATAALNEAKSYTNTSVNNETTSRQAAINTIDSRLLTYATRSEVEEAIKPESIATGLLNNNQFKTELVSAVNQDVSALSTRVGALEAEDTTINNRLATFSTKQELSGAVADINNTIDNLELGIDENVVIGIIDDQIGKKKVLTESSNVFTAVKDTVDAIPDNYYNMKTVDDKIADVVTGGDIDLSGYLAKNELIGELKNISDTEICLTKDCIAGLDLGVDEDAVISIIGNQFSENKVLTENSTAFKAVKDTVDAIPDNYYSMSTVDKKIADAVTGGEIDLSGYLAKEDLGTELKNISDTEICLTKNCVAGQVADGISGLELVVDEDTVIGIIDNQFSKNKVLTENSTVFTELKSTVDAIPNNYYSKETVDEKIADAASGGEIDLSGYLKTSDFTEENLTKMKNGQLMTSTDTDNLLKDYAAKSDLNDYVLEGKLKEKIEGIKTSDDEQLFITRNNVAEVLSNTYATKKELTDAIAGVDGKIGELSEFVTDGDATVAKAIAGVKSTADEAKTIAETVDGKIGDLSGVASGKYVTVAEAIADVDSLGNRVGALETAEYLKTSDFTKGLVISKITDDTCTTKDCLFEDYTTTENLEKYYAAKSDLNDYVLEGELKEKIEGIKTSDDKQLFITRNNVNEVISKDSLVEDLLNDESFKAALGGAVVDGLEDLPSDVVTLQTNVANLQTGVASLQEKDTEIDGKINTMQGTIDGLSNTYATKKELTDAVSEGNLTETLNGVYLASGALNNYYTKEETKSYVDDAVSAGKLQEKIEGIVTSDGEQLFITRNNVNEAINKDSLANALLANGTFTAGLNNTYYTKAETNKAIGDAVAAEATERTNAGYLTSSSLDGYATEGYVATEVGKEAAARSAELASYAKTEVLDGYVTNSALTGAVNNAIANDSTISKMQEDISANAKAASDAQSAADKASATADTASATATAASSAASEAGRVATAASSAAGEAQTAASEAGRVANAANEKIGDLSAFDTGKGVTVAEAISGVADVADNAATTVQDLGDQLCGENLQCEAGSFTPTKRQ